MPDIATRRLLALWRREFQEYRTSLLWTPLALIAGVAVVMLLALLFADSFSALDEHLRQIVPPPDASEISIRIGESDTGEPTLEYDVRRRLGPLEGGAAAMEPDDPAPTPDTRRLPTGSVDALLNGLHILFLWTLMLVCANYLLAALFVDRRDRSVLFWKSMPVSDWGEVLARFCVAVVAAPLLYLAATLVAQVVFILLAMALLWRMEWDPFLALLQDIDLTALLAGQLQACLLLNLWLAPTYAWLLLASAGARRSPFMLAVALPLGLVLVERALLGTSHIAAAISRHLPHYGVDSHAGFYWYGWVDLPALLVGLLFAALALWGAVCLRRYRFET